MAQSVGDVYRICQANIWPCAGSKCSVCCVIIFGPRLWNLTSPNLDFLGMGVDLVYPIEGCADGDAGDHALIAPPSVITAQQIDRAVEQLRGAILEAALS